MLTNWIAIYSNKQTGSVSRTITLAAANIIEAAKMAQGQARQNIEIVTRLLRA